MISKQALAVAAFSAIFVFACRLAYKPAVASSITKDATLHGEARRAHDGQHDFDFALGTWKTHIKQLQRSGDGSARWISVDGTAVIRKVWNGLANLEEIEAEGATGHFEGLTLRLYDPQARQWNLYWASSRDGKLGQPMTGEFKNGRGEFYDQEVSNGRAVFMRNIYFDMTPNSYQFEQAASDDGGKTWEPNFTAELTRLEQDADETKIQGTGAAAAAHDFDWQFGNWQVHMSRLLHPLTGSRTWTPLAGTVLVNKIWNGRANLAEIDVSGPSGRLLFLSLRLFDPQTHQWTLLFANSSTGAVGVPMHGTFNKGRGVFYDQESANNKRFFVRFVFSDATANSARDEQAFSNDAGRTWEVNWVNRHTRMKG